MAFLYQDGDGISPYIKARQRFYSPEGWHQLITSIQTSSTLYIGNLSFFTEELQIYTLFSLVAPVKRVIMGLNKVTKSPCGFCFVEYFTNEEAVLARRYLDHMKLDGRIIRVDMDPGFEEGRQYGRGKSGGQVRDFHRTDFDQERGGWGEIVYRMMRGGGRGGRGGGGRGRGRRPQNYEIDQMGARPPPYKRQRVSSVSPQRTPGNDNSNPRFRDKESDDDE
eukprot:139296_1